MKRGIRIYCVEGHWNYGNREVEPTVEPMLEQLRRLGHWEYARRDCATLDQLEYFLNAEWERCNSGSILYIATHGSEVAFSLSDDCAVALEQLTEYLLMKNRDCTGRWIHFGSCHVMKATNSRLKDFVRKTKAAGVSGYTEAAGWTEAQLGPIPGAPALASDLLFFTTIKSDGINLSHKTSLNRLDSIQKDLRRRFPDCGFKLLIKE